MPPKPEMTKLLRLQLFDPGAMSEAQLGLYNRLSAMEEQRYGNAFRTKDANDRPIGPFGVVMHTPSVGQAFYDTAAEVGRIGGLSTRAREMAILIVGARYAAKYELYAHTALGLKANLSATQIQKIRDCGVPEGLSEEESVVFEVASALVREAGPLREDLWQRATRAIGTQGVLALAHSVGFYAYLCIVLNTFDAKVSNTNEK